MNTKLLTLALPIALLTGCTSGVNWPANNDIVSAEHWTSQHIAKKPMSVDEDLSEILMSGLETEQLREEKLKIIRAQSLKVLSLQLDGATPLIMIEISSSWDWKPFDAVLLARTDTGGMSYHIVRNDDDSLTPPVDTFYQHRISAEQFKKIETIFSPDKLLKTDYVGRPVMDGTDYTFTYWDKNLPNTRRCFGFRENTTYSYMLEMLLLVVGPWDDDGKFSANSFNRQLEYIMTHHYIKQKQWDKAYLSYKIAMEAAGDAVECDSYYNELFFQIIEHLTGSKADIELALIPAGEFIMGRVNDFDIKDATPPHRVKITKPFYMSKYEITQAQFEQVMGYYHWSSAGAPNNPVDNVSWDEAMEFCKRQSEFTGKTFRLPTEAEWEYAARAGTTTPFCTGQAIDFSQANVGSANIDGIVHKNKLQAIVEVGSYKPNNFGLYDCHGNVREWCSDWHDKGYYAKSPLEDPTGPTTGTSSDNLLDLMDLAVLRKRNHDHDQAEPTYRVVRGGAWSDEQKYWHSATRDLGCAEAQYPNTGFRVVVEVEETK